MSAVGDARKRQQERAQAGAVDGEAAKVAILHAVIDAIYAELDEARAVIAAVEALAEKWEHRWAHIDDVFSDRFDRLADPDQARATVYELVISEIRVALAKRQSPRCTCDPGPEGQHRDWCAIEASP